MEKVVITFREDIMAKHNKTLQQKTKLLELLKEYGAVEDYETVVASIKNEYQTSLDNLNKEYRAIADQHLTDNEIRVIKMLREILTLEGKDYLDRIALLEKTLNDVRSENQNRAKQIIAMLGEEQ